MEQTGAGHFGGPLRFPMRRGRHDVAAFNRILTKLKILMEKGPHRRTTRPFFDVGDIS